MREIPKKNYYILIALLVVTALLTLLLSNSYLNKEKLVSNFYEYSNKITPKEFDQFMTENSDVIIYISDKYDLTNGNFESKLEKKLDDLNLKHNFVFIDKNEINKKFIKKLKNTYGINIDVNKTPVVIVIVDEQIVKNISITTDSDIDTIIDFEVFE